MSSYKTLKAYLNSHEDFIKSEGLNKRDILKYVHNDMMNPEQVLKVLEKKYAKYNKKQQIEYQQDQEVIDEIPEPTKEDKNDNLESNIKLIENENIEEKTIEIWFKRGSKTLFKDIKPIIIKKIDQIKTIEGVFFQVFYKTEGHIRATTYSLNNNIGMEKVKNLLVGDTFELVNNYVEGQDIAIECSDTNKDNINKLTLDMITGFRITHKKNLFKKLGQNSTTIYCDNGGSFYNYKINNKYKDCNVLLNKLLKYQISNDLTNEMFNFNCITWALKMSGKLPESTINNIKINSYSRYVSYKDLQQLGENFNIAFKVVKYREDKNKWDDITRGKKVIGSIKNDAVKIDLAIIDKHYILNEDVEGINKFALSHYEEIKKACPNKPDEWILKVKRIKNGKYEIDNAKAHIKSYELVQIISNEKIRFSFEELQHLPTALYDISNSEIKDISVFDDSNFIEYKPKDANARQEQTKEKDIKQKDVEHAYYYADCECDVVSFEFHKAYCISYKERNEKDIHFIYGDDCLEQFLNILPNNSVVYFHNLGYDARMFSKFVITSSIDKGTKTMTQQFNHKGKHITFKDSYSIISMPLSKFPEAFNLESGEKEMFPYRYYTFERLNKNVGKISEAGNQELKFKWNQKEFENNIEKLKLYVDEKGNKTNDKTDYFNMIEYVKFYCNQDVNILAQGFNKFRDMCIDFLKLDCDETLTAPSLANKYFENNLYYNIDNFYKYSGTVRAFIQQAVYGGRCMTRDNEKWKTFIKLFDFDAVSLYPSAMKRLYCQTGKPQLLEQNELNLNYLLEKTCAENEQPNNIKYISSYIVEIRILKVNKHLHFPLIVVKDKKTKTNRNTNEAEGYKMVVDNITLEDFVKYQGVECEILRGYKWTDKKDFQIQSLIQKLHEFRCEFKKTNNPMQEVVKLIMNSAYGKMIQKPIKDKFVYKKYESVDKKGNKKYPLNAYMIKNSAKISEINQINNNLYQVKTTKPIYKFCTNTLLGVQVLSMSKRIMNEVMTTAEDLNIKIFYQDTDSMHIEKDKLKDLEIEFKNRYGRDLVGKNLGQFHNDFNELNESWAYQSIFNGKKCYIDMLTNEEGKYAIHNRAKGVSLDTIDKLANEIYNGDKFKLYDDLFNEKKINFDLLTTKPGFKNNKNRQISNCLKFTRTLSFKGNKNIVN